VQRSSFRLRIDLAPRTAYGIPAELLGKKPNSTSHKREVRVKGTSDIFSETQKNAMWIDASAA